MLLHVLLLLHASAGASSSISCYDDQGKPVDWCGGDVGYILYNDQPPQQQKLSGDATRSCGHTKGVVVFDKQQGFWLVHSTPHFPPPKSQGQFSYPASGISNGQNFICVTYPFERFQTIGEQLKINQPHIYDCSIPASLAAAVPAMAQLCKHTLGRWDNTSSSPSNRSISLLSLAGSEFISFAKGASFANGNTTCINSLGLPLRFSLTCCFSSGDAHQRNPALDCLQLESPQQRSHSPEHHVQGLQSGPLEVGRQCRMAAAWKWDVGGWVCVGDINRDKAEGEERRRGTVCRQDAWRCGRAFARRLQCESLRWRSGRRDNPAQYR
ncbi:hypothetical protein cypCar_00032026 [Cyprinus carpio]|nr:hypothetical protein cypCar_00032026 [Cyprinus carpio]